MYWGLFSWMTFSKFIKLVTHFVRYPVDILLWPVSIVFGWLHGVIKMWALLSLNQVRTSFLPLSGPLLTRFLQTTWGSRTGADADNNDRMIKQPRPQYEYFYDEKTDEKIPLYDDMKAYETRISATAA